MSIYATIACLTVPRDGCFLRAADDWVALMIQAVPAHIGHPSGYPDGDPYADFLPPVVDYAPDRVCTPRAVFICGPDTRKDGQRYINPLVSLTGAEYEAIRWVDLWERITQALREPTDA